MTAGAGQGFFFEAADHIVPDPVPVTAHALEPGGGVDVPIELVLRGPGRGRAMTRQASVVVRLVRDLEESPVFGVEKGRGIADGRDDGPFPVVRIRAVDEVPVAASLEAMPPTSPRPAAAVAAQRKFSLMTCRAHSLGS
jgi:hypothetical protein